MPDEDGEPDDLLYHYTNAYALNQILSSGILWASKAQFLNDAQEVIFGREYMAEQLEAKAYEVRPEVQPDDHGPASLKYVAAQSALKTLKTLQTYAPGIHRVFVTCFCQNGNLLSQWRSYGQDGYAIGFRKSALLKTGFGDFTEPEGLGHYFWTRPKPELHRVTYVDQVDSAVIDDKMLETILPGPMDMGDTTLIQKAEWRTLYELAKIKNAAFKEESEWRLIFVARGDRSYTVAGPGEPEVPVQVVPTVHFRNSSATPVPYIQLKVDPVPAFAEIIIGPSPNQALRMEALKRVLAEYQLPDVEVKTSNTPFRG